MQRRKLRGRNGDRGERVRGNREVSLRAGTQGRERISIPEGPRGERSLPLQESPGAQGQTGAPCRLTPGIVLPVVTELRILGQWIEDVGTATLLDHVLLEAGADAHLEERGVMGKGVQACPLHTAGKGTALSTCNTHIHTHKYTPPTFN